MWLSGRAFAGQKFFRLMKHALLAAAFFTLIFNQMDAQTVVWNKELPLKSHSSNHCSVQQIGDRILFSAQKSIVELDWAGTITGAVITLPTSILNYEVGRFLREKFDPKTGERYFLMAYRNLNEPKSIIFTEYRPGQGFTNETSLDEGTISSSLLAPTIVDINDSTFAVFGRKYARQVTHRPGQGVVVNWEQPYYQGIVNAAIRTDDGGYITATNTGNILALSATGDSLWKIIAGFGIRDLKKTAQGFVACGRNTSNQAVVAEYSSTGVLLWTAGDAADQAYEHLVVESDGSLTLSGQSATKQILLTRLSANGTLIWRKTYQVGRGGSLAKMPDGGYVLAAASESGILRFWVIKTDAEGNTTAGQSAVQPSHRRLENSQMLAQFLPSGTMFFDATEDSKFWVPKDSMTKILFAESLWLGALDSNGVLSLSTSTYTNDGKSDYRPGLSGGPAKDFAHAWRISRTEIESLRQDWADNGKIDQPIPHDLLTWPAKGNPYFTQSLDFSKPITDKALLPAPFVDVNGDGLYSPTDGDFPRIKGDQMVWCAITDSTKHTESGGNPLVVDIATSVYLYDCAPNTRLENSLFVDYEIINRSGSPYSKLFASLWTDPEIGCPWDDYVGCLPASNAHFVYNQDAVDGQPGASCDGGTRTFREKIPVGSTTWMNTSLDRFSYFNYGGSIASYPLAIYNAMQGLYLNTSTGIVTYDSIVFRFPGNPADLDSNSMCGRNLSFGDRRTLGSTGPFTFAPNDTFRLSVAFTYHPDIPHPCPDIYGSVKNDVDQLRSLFSAGALDGPAKLPASVKLLVGQSVTLNASVPGATAYQWSNGSTLAQISVAQPGIYTVTITKATGCQSVEIVSVQSASGAHSPNTWLQQFRLYPNPNTGQFRVEMSGPAHDEVEFTLFNAVGQFIRRDMEGFGTGRLARSFDYGQLPSGVYALRVQAGNEAMWVKVVVER